MPKLFSPYVGPRPFEREHAPLFFGRDREANELVSLIISHTEVLLYAQSGAGKSSLVNARLIPLLEGEAFDVLPPARVQGVLEGVEAGEIKNIYAFHSLMTWAGREADPKRFAQMSLADFLRERRSPIDEEGTPMLRVAIFDQFEEGRRTRSRASPCGGATCGGDSAASDCEDPGRGLADGRGPGDLGAQR